MREDISLTPITFTYLHVFCDYEDRTNIFAANTIKLHKIVVTEFSHNLEKAFQNHGEERKY